jgi:hypothetical protein
MPSCWCRRGKTRNRYEQTLAECALTPARKRKLTALAGRPDSEIDFSDIPPLTESFWNNAAVRNPFYRKSA